MKKLLQDALYEERQRSKEAIDRAVGQTQETVQSKMEDMAKVQTFLVVFVNCLSLIFRLKKQLLSVF